ncbi:MAG: hypothetical protein IM487_18465 [Microcystis sp. M152S2]|uniref:hypothetical protein n=1 Tax=Microcystis sp. M152S2 TaxID=2771150 RepID=UPI00258A63BA|nr:hypothetical protein [Microcystis sp. M152S2]MCA2768843.1 hypothetical protein [Microcystis sp. M152S2]
MAHGQTQITGKDDAQKQAVEAFKALVDSKKSNDKSVTSASVFLSIWEAYQSAQYQNGFELTVDEELEVLEAVATGVTRSQLTKTGLLAESRKVAKQAKNLEALKVSMEAGQDNIDTTIRGSANLRIDRAVKTVFAHNDSQSDIDKQWFLTPTSVQKLTNCNMIAIKAYMGYEDKETGVFVKGTHTDLIESHHTKHGLSEDTNRGRKGRSIVKEIVIVKEANE